MYPYLCMRHVSVLPACWSRNMTMPMNPIQAWPRHTPEDLASPGGDNEIQCLDSILSCNLISRTYWLLDPILPIWQLLSQGPMSHDQNYPVSGPQHTTSPWTWSRTSWQCLTGQWGWCHRTQLFFPRNLNCWWLAGDAEDITAPLAHARKRVLLCVFFPAIGPFLVYEWGM